MRYSSIAALIGCTLVYGVPPQTRTFTVPADARIGRNLEAFTSIRLSPPAPAEGLAVTVTSGDPARLLFAAVPDAAGTGSLTLKVDGQYPETPDFYLQAFGESGSVGYTVSAPGYETAHGKVLVTPSTIMLRGPFRSHKFQTSLGTPVRITLTAARVDQGGKAGPEQPIAGGLKATVRLSTSDGRVGQPTQPTVVLGGGEVTAVTGFEPAGAGSTDLTATIPTGFTTLPESASLTAIVDLPGIGITGYISIGKDLQATGYVLLGEPAPRNGLDVTLTSADPKRIVLSAREDQPGSGSITLHVSPGESRAPYSIQALSDSGTATYTATAAGYRPRTANVTLAPSGVMVVWEPYGAPDEAAVLRPLTIDPRPFTVPLLPHKATPLAVWTVYLDPVTHRGADMTAQRLRPGISPIVELTSSNPSVGKVTRDLVLNGAFEPMVTEFTPLETGQTVISVSTPPGFATPSNATSVTATVTAK